MISIVIPTYNRVNVISKILDNLLAQTCSEWQCVIVDDHSTDNTEAVVQQYVAKDSRFKYLKNTRAKGAQGARNTGILAADGEWICLFDSDDVMYPNYIERMQNGIDKGDADVIACYAAIRNTRTGEIQGWLDEVDNGHIQQRLLNGKLYVGYDVCIIKKQRLLEIGLLDEQCPSMQEWDTHIRLSKRCLYCVIPEVLCEWMVGSNDAISQDNQKHNAGKLYIFRKHAWVFRRYAYRRFLYSLKGLWEKVPHPASMLLWAPEMMVYMTLYKLLRNK